MLASFVWILHQYDNIFLSIASASGYIPRSMRRAQTGVDVGTDSALLIISFCIFCAVVASACVRHQPRGGGYSPHLMVGGGAA